MLQDEFCPDCGTPRAALFRYCLECGLDYDALDLSFEPPGGPYSPTPPGGWPQSGFIARPRSVPTTTRDRRAERRSRPDRRGGRVRPVPLAAIEGRRRQPRGYAVIGIGVIIGLVAVGFAASTDLPANLRSNWDTLASEVARLVAPPAVAVAPSQAPQTPLPEVTPTPAPSVIVPPLPDILPGPRAVEAVVTEVFDGNTIVVELGGTIERVRYLNVVIPSGTPDADAVALEAARLNDSIVAGHTVWLEPDVSDTDDEGRLLRHVWVEEDGRFLLVGTWLVLSGVAETDFTEPDVAYKDVFMEAQDYARRQAIGIWGTPSAELPTTGESPPPGATPSPITSFRTYTSTEQVIVPEGTDLKLEGTLGRFVWRTVSFYSTQSTIAWTIDSTRRTGCRLDWFVQPSVGGAPTSLSIPIVGEQLVTGSQPLDSRAATATITVESTCPEWTLRLQGIDQ